jgi:hypothetical protein
MTALAIYLSLNIQVSRGEQGQLLTYPLLSLTGLCVGLWTVWAGLALVGERGATLLGKIEVGLTLLRIGCTSVAWGVL